jgi:hypothetical protein
MPSFIPPNDPPLVDPADRQSWVPRMKAGYFYINDRQYYLYADKRTITLRDATCLIFELAEAPIPETVQVLVEGVPYRNVEMQGRELVVKLDDQASFADLWTALQDDLNQWGFVLNNFGFGPSNEIEVTYRTLLWQPHQAGQLDPTGNVFTSPEVTEVFKIKEADRVEYRLTKPRDYVTPASETQITDAELIRPTGIIGDPPAPCTPVVITDDTRYYTDQRDFQTQFHVDPITGDIFFNTRRNLVQNPSFEIRSTGIAHTDPTYQYPLEWRVTDTSLVLPGTGEAYHGQVCLDINSTGQLIQTVAIDPLEPHTVSMFFRDGTGRICVNFLDEDYVYLDTDGQPQATGQPQDGLCNYIHDVNAGNGQWTRGSMTFGEVSTVCEYTGVVDQIPLDAAFMEIKAQQLGANTCVDAAQLEVGYDPTQYEPLLPTITIEYERGRLGIYTPDPDAELPVEIVNVDTNPLNVVEPGGFLFIEEFSNVDDHQLGVGQIIEGQATSPTGVLQLTGTIGIEVGRQHLPYAKTSGFTKFRQRPTFHLENQPPVYDISDLTIESGNPNLTPNSIEFELRDGLRIVNDQLQLVVIPDRRISVRLDAMVADQYQNPTFVYTADVSTTTGGVEPSDPITSHQGQLHFDYSPPTYVGPLTGDVGLIDTIRVAIGGLVQTLPVYGYLPAGLDLTAYLS